MSGKLKYRIQNWSSYNKALVNRGNVTLWFEEDVIDHWRCSTRSGRRGRPFYYTDAVIELCLVLRYLHHLPLRATQGFVQGILSMMALTMRAPDYSLLCKRGGHQSIDLRRFRPETPIDIVVDATGLKVFGEGEWKVRTHGKNKRRVWKKIHISADASTHEIIAIRATDSKVADCDELPNLLPPSDPIARVYGDGAFDNQKSYDAIVNRRAIPKIPPRHGAALARNPSWGMVARNINVRGVWLLGRKTWKQASGYHRRSLAETTVGRFKQAFGGSLRSKISCNQTTEVRVKAQILNRMTHLGMPISYKIS